MEASFEELRPRAFAIAYRMLGSVSEAEDVVQEGLLRLHRPQEGERIESPRAFLSTVVTRLAIDQLRSARARRETLRRRVAAGAAARRARRATPPAQAEVADSLSLAFLVLLERLSPEQRAVFLLREVFDYPYDRIAEIVGKSEANVRQLAVRARRHVERGARCASRPRASSASSSPTASSRPSQEGDLAALEALLAEDVELHGDGGGKVPALARALCGRIARGAHAAQLGARGAALRRRGDAPRRT